MIKKIKLSANAKVVIIIIIMFLAIYVLDYTHIGIVAKNSFLDIIGYLLMPILAVGGVLTFVDSIKNIFKKEAMSEGVILYILWWVWVLFIVLFTVGATVTFIKLTMQLIQ
ncbi:hypothetical protein [Acinetobacter junii]|uniref:hypothetical protein n=1 Tax=Acinetobacter junii TaxID=40215 RepID=UPI00125065AF|nr:hypothetical protein [Acinetobacter junii]